MFLCSKKILSYISIKTKSKSHINIWEEKTSEKWKNKSTVLMFQELMNIEYFLGDV